MATPETSSAAILLTDTQGELLTVARSSSGAFVLDDAAFVQSIMLSNIFQAVRRLNWKT